VKVETLPGPDGPEQVLWKNLEGQIFGGWYKVKGGYNVWGKRTGSFRFIPYELGWTPPPPPEEGGPTEPITWEDVMNEIIDEAIKDEEPPPPIPYRLHQYPIVWWKSVKKPLFSNSKMKENSNFLSNLSSTESLAKR